MNMLNAVKEIFTSDSEFIKSKNYYYENHLCPVGGGQIKIMMDYKIATEKNDKLIKIGQCPVCKQVYYHEGFETKTV